MSEQVGAQGLDLATGAWRWRAAAPVTWRRTASMRACSVRSPTPTTRPPGTAHASTSSARPSDSDSRRDTAPEDARPPRDGVLHLGRVGRGQPADQAIERVVADQAARRRARGHGVRQRREGGAEGLHARLGRGLQRGRPRGGRGRRPRTARRHSPRPSAVTADGASGGDRLGRDRHAAQAAGAALRERPDQGAREQAQQQDQGDDRGAGRSEGPGAGGERGARDDGRPGRRACG